jgi:dienelactone hydrolase
VKSGLIVLFVFLSSNSLAAQPQKVSVPSLDGKLELVGYWFEAKTPGPRPVIISLHGCGGAYDPKGRLNAGFYRDGAYFNAEAMHVLALDSFSPRGLRSICEIKTAQRPVNEYDRRDDVFAALQWLSRQPGVDAQRIVILGRSHGAQTVLATIERDAAAVRAQSVQPRAAIAVYPGCGKFLRTPRYATGAPLLVMIGELDDWTPAKPCVELQRKLRAAQPEAVFDLEVYPESYHGFDSLAPVRVRENIGSVKVGHAHVGGNGEARWRAHQRTFDFVSAQLALPLTLSHEERYKLKVEQ